MTLNVRPKKQRMTHCILTGCPPVFPCAHWLAPAQEISNDIAEMEKSKFLCRRLHSQFQPEFEKNFYESQLIVLDTLERCLSGQPKETSRYDEAMNVKSLLRELCQFIDVPSENHMVTQLKNLASKVLFSLSLNNFNAVFSRISARMQELSNSNEENPDLIDIELIQHINLDVTRLIKLLNDCCDRLFDLLDNFAENNNKKRMAAWPLQMMLLVLCSKILEEIVHADAGAPFSPKHYRKRQFVDSVKKALVPHSSSKQQCEAAAVTCVRLCKTSTYINILDSNNVVFSLVQSVINDLKMLLFNPCKPFCRSQATINQDVDLMIDCFVSCFRINPHNNEALKVCLNLNSPSTFHFVLVSSLHRIITQTRLQWWPQIDIVYSKAPELRNMFTDTLTKVTQGCISHTPLRMIQSLTLKEKVSTLKFKEKSEESLNYKNLLLWMVRLIHADPFLMLNVSI
ncbi:neurofibromin [Trichonephila clavipes]|nr:neurofibromin [Trichonephila clavipes]